MKQYEFGAVKKTLKKNTFETEELVKEAIGANEKNEQKILLIQKEFSKLQKEYTSKLANPKRKKQIEQRMTEINEEVLAMSNSLRWSTSFENCMKVVDILFVEGNSGLTKANFGRFDAEQAWKDFFTAPSQSETESD